MQEIIGVKKSKREHLIFLDSDDIFKENMLEELYIKIKGNDLEIIIWNSKNLYTLNNKKIFDDKKYDFSDEILMIVNQLFQFDIKKIFWIICMVAIG